MQCYSADMLILFHSCWIDFSSLCLKQGFLYFAKTTRDSFNLLVWRDIFLDALCSGRLSKRRWCLFLSVNVRLDVQSAHFFPFIFNSGWSCETPTSSIADGLMRIVGGCVCVNWRVLIELMEELSVKSSAMTQTGGDVCLGYPHVSWVWR